MKCVVAYYSETGNTKRLAKVIYDSIGVEKKSLMNIEENQKEDADLYFIGFPIHNYNCSMKVIEYLEQIENSKIALFVTCGLNPVEKYKNKLEDSLLVWMNDSNQYLGMHLCQCKTENKQKEKFYINNINYREQLKEMFDQTENHPNSEDEKQVIQFVNSCLFSV